MKPGSDASVALVRADVLVLLREKRYEEALQRLYRARSETPGSAELQKSIDQVKEFLIGAYAKRLGGLDQIARPVTPAAGRSPDVVLLSRYIDGSSSFGDLAQICPLGQLRTLQVLVEMYAQKPAAAGLLAVEPEVPYSGPRTLDEPSVLLESEPPPPDTARSPASLPSASPASESPEAKQYREAFAQGTAAFIQRRYEDAQRAFQECDALRPGDGPADVMLRRVRRELEIR